MSEFPRLLQTVIDTTDVRGLAEFYRELLGLRYRSGDERPAPGEPDDADWLSLTDADGTIHEANAAIYDDAADNTTNAVAADVLENAADVEENKADAAEANAH